MSQRPIALALFLCEQVIVDEETRAVTLVNCFSQRRAAQVPAAPFPFVLVTVLTDGSGEFPVEVQITRLDTDEIVYRREARARFQHPLQEVRFRLRLTSFSFPAACVYEVLFLADGEVVAHRRFEITLSEEQT